jgi:hypothetical protein
MHATDLVGINGIAPVLLVYTCQQGVYPLGDVLPLRLPEIIMEPSKPPQPTQHISWTASGRGRQVYLQE